MNVSELYKVYLSHPDICTDTRKITPNCIFFALKGGNFNGNKFAKEALNQGAAFVVIDEKEFKLSDDYILVNDVLETLQNLARFHRKQLTIPVIGITGTNGKTTTKELMNAVLSKKYKTTATVGNLNNHIGVPLTLLSIPADCEIAIIEMGANHIGEIEFLCNIALPNYGIITNIGTAHIEGFGSFEGIKKTKNELYEFIRKNSGTVFLSTSDHILSELAINIKQVTYGINDRNCSGKIISSSPTLQLEWNCNATEVQTIESNLYGSYNFDNILAAICIGKHFDVSDNLINEAINEYAPSNNRSQIIKTETTTIFLDAYNANPTSMKASVDDFSKIDAKNKLMILGDMLELGNISNDEHQKMIDTIESLKIETIFVGKEFNAVKNKYLFKYLKNYTEVIGYLNTLSLNDYNILIKGSRGIQLEKVAEYLQNKESNLPSIEE